MQHQSHQRHSLRRDACQILIFNLLISGSVVAILVAMFTHPATDQTWWVYLLSLWRNR